MATAFDINLYHRQLLSSLNTARILGQKAALRVVRDLEWEDEKFEGPVDFELYPLDTRLIGASERRRDVPVFAFEKVSVIGRELEEITEGKSSARCWIGWHEQWERFAPFGVYAGRKEKEKEKAPFFMLSAIQWILFWGARDDDSKVQIMRAEWDNVAHLAPHRKKAGNEQADDGDSLAGQPHWHVDPPLELGDFSSFDLFRGSELEEEAGHEFSGKYLKLKRVHLAMSGWSNPVPQEVAAASKKSKKDDVVHAARWQMDYCEDTDRLVDWNLSVLRYIKTQINYIND